MSKKKDKPNTKDQVAAKFAGIIRRSKEDVKKQKLDELEVEESAKELEEDSKRLKKEEGELSEADQQILDALEQSRLQEEKKKKRKQQIKQLSILGGIVFFIYVVYLLFLPRTGTMDYGICRVFLEMQTRFPDNLNLSVVQETGNRTRIWYRSVDAYGEYRLSRIQCNYKYYEGRGRLLSSVMIDRQEIDDDIVQAFNQTIPILWAIPPDLTYPAALPSAVSHLQFNVDAFRKPIF